MHVGYVLFMDGDIVWLGTVASLVAGLATGFGALPVLFTRRVSDRLLDTMLGFAAGVMLAATSFSLLVPSLELGGPWIAVLGLLLGAIVLHLIDGLSLISVLHLGLKVLPPDCQEYGCSSLL